MVGCRDKIRSNNDAEVCKSEETDNVGDMPRSGRTKAVTKKEKRLQVNCE